MELSLFSEWLLVRFLDIALTDREGELLRETADLLVDAVDSQPKVCVHRDFHSRNLLLNDAGELGIVDFQDSLHGPYAYDPVSLLRDCYVTWPQSRIEDWARRYHRRALDAGVPAPPQFDTFMRDFDLAGVQRQLKAIGIFARLHLRDERDTLLQYIPPVLEQLIEVSHARPELEKFGELLEARVLRIAQRRIESMHS
jgi:aminoglycoside/choline kinase family phosphotransferase